MTWHADLNGKRTWEPQAWAAFAGRFPKSSRPSSGNWTDEVHPEDRDRYRGVVSTCIGASAPFSMDYRLILGDGSHRWVMDRGLPEYLPDGLVGYTGYCVDIHARRLLEECLAERTREIRVREWARTDRLIDLATELRSLEKLCFFWNGKRQSTDEVMREAREGVARALSELDAIADT